MSHYVCVIFTTIENVAIRFVLSAYKLEVHKNLHLFSKLLIIMVEYDKWNFHYH
jgi:hypothetical protein